MKRLEFGEDKEDRELAVLYNNAKPRSSSSEEEALHLYSLNSIKNALMKFDLSKNEIRVYLYLARSGAERAQNIAEAISVHRTETYKILRRLERQGLVSCTLERPMKFISVPFDKALSNLIESRRQRLKALERRKEELIELWCALPKFDKVQPRDETFQILEGKEQINTKAEDLLRECKKELLMVTSDDYLLHLYNATFFDDFAKFSRKRKFDARILTNFCQTTSYILERVDLGEADFSYLDVEESPNFIISDCEELLFFLEGDEALYAICTNYKSLVKSFRLLFLLLWRKNSIPMTKALKVETE